MKKVKRYVFENGFEVLCKNTKHLKKLCGNDLIFIEKGTNWRDNLLIKSINIKIR